jgi:hypothetical protein
MNLQTLLQPEHEIEGVVQVLVSLLQGTNTTKRMLDGYISQLGDD